MLSKYFPGLPFGKYRREVVAPAELPEVDNEGLHAFRNWRNKTYKQPILDDLVGYYRLEPPTKLVAEMYTGSKSKARGSAPLAAEVVVDYVRDPESVDPAHRQIIHTAESAEMATAVFLGVAVLRSEVIEKALRDIANERPMADDIAAYAADAIIDMGLCLEEPFERNWRLKPGERKNAPKGLSKRLEREAPGLGTNLVDFGAYASLHHEAFVASPYDAVDALEAAYEEQNYRMAIWLPSHTAITEAFPELPLSKEILYMQEPLDKLLSIQYDLAT
ncbi:hypothetical protein BH10PAT3_BH10PAT3_6820 [soil metagenome]